MIDTIIHNHSLKKRLSLFFLEKKNGVAYLLLVPSLVLIFGILIYPLFYSLFISFHDYLLTKPGIYNFIGLANYLEALQSSFFLKSVIRTLYFAFVTVGVELVLGLGVALVLQQKFRGRGLVRGLIILPWALPTSVNGIMWKWIYNANYGVLNALLKRLGLIERYQVWLADPTRALHLVMLANIWKETPVGVLMFLAVLEQIPRELYEAALVDGANTLKKFWYITLPMLKPMMVTLAIIKIIWAIREFDIFYIITRGGPGEGTSVLSYYAYLTSFKFSRMGFGSAIAYLVIVLVILIGIPYFRYMRKQEVD